MQINSGIIRYERVVKDDDFGINRKLSGELSFTVGDGEHAFEAADTVASTLIGLIHLRLGVKSAGKATVSVGTAAQQPGVGSPSPPPTGTKEAAAYAMNKEDGKGPTEAPKPPRGPGRPKKEMPAVAADPLAEMTGSPVQPAASETVQGSVTASTDPLADLSADADELDGLLGEAPAPIVTDADLSKAITKKAGELKDGPRIRELANKFGGGPLPKQLRDIPAGKRWAFIQELNALK